MPPLGTEIADEDALKLISQWIEKDLVLKEEK
jgi:hypothetical protein